MNHEEAGVFFSLLYIYKEEDPTEVIRLTPLTMAIIGVAAALVLHVSLRYTKLPPFAGMMVFLALIFLSAALWVVSFAVGGWQGLGYGALAMLVMVASMAGLVMSFILAFLVKE
ncbi:YesK family protein [Rossellomorea marisflavi]|jgi:YesK-like protein|uniref:YesK family protein n=1 Tax=Rossellomorea marisflavi TaxID=189381 RepID=UPI00114D772F|nr:YesK family protein [Rossellomorea marisflavi]